MKWNNAYYWILLPIALILAFIAYIISYYQNMNTATTKPTIPTANPTSNTPIQPTPGYIEAGSYGLRAILPSVPPGDHTLPIGVPGYLGVFTSGTATSGIPQIVGVIELD